MNAEHKKTQKNKLHLSVQYGVNPEDAPSRPKIRRWVTAALKGEAEITVRIVSEDEGRALNRDYRGKDYATNVLTFVYDDAGFPSGVPSGDLVLCAPVVSREADEQNKSVEAHYAHLLVHGMLHLQGYDHENDADAEVMEKLESKIVTKLGYANPYEDEKVISNE